MFETVRSFGGVVSAPHHLAANAGLRVLDEGGNAVEAMIAAAAVIAVCYPHMNGLGGDSVWLIAEPGEDPVGIDACGAAAGLASIDYYRERGLSALPGRGADTALTVAGAVSGWQAGYRYSEQRLDGRLPMTRLLEEAVHYAQEGVAVSRSQAKASRAKFDELAHRSAFAATFFPHGKPPADGDRLRQPELATTLERLAKAGLDDFYRGDLARSLASDLEALDTPLRLDDLDRHQAITDVAPLTVSVAGHRLFNMPPPTQGLASLVLLAVFAHIGVREAEGFDFVHALVEATKVALRVRDTFVTDPAYMTFEPETFLQPVAIPELASAIDPKRASPWPDAEPGGDTVWLGAIDRDGRAVSFIQSIYWEFGSGVMLPETGIHWQNRGISFSLDPEHQNHLKPRRRPRHTIQPAIARLGDGRLMAYGAMGGDGQPQTQAILFARHAIYGQNLQEAITAPRWLLGRTWGEDTASLKLENRFSLTLIDALASAGHEVDLVKDFDEIVGHAGAVVHHPNGLMEGASDPRSDGTVAAR